MASNSVRSGNGTDGGNRTSLAALASQDKANKSLKQIRSEQDEYKAQVKIEKEIQKLQKKGVQDIEKQRVELQKKYMDELAKKSAKQVKSDIQLQKEAENEGYLRRAKERQDQKAQQKKEKKERQAERAAEIAAAKEAALEQMEGATSLGDKVRGAFKYAGASLLEYGHEFASGLGDSLAEAAANAVNNVAGALSDSVDKYLGVYSRHMTEINARIQGAYKDMDYEALVDVVLSNASGSPYYKIEDVLDNLNALVQAGTATNLTQRAFLATISSKVATTFNALEPSLLRLIRIQQDDSTAARLGMEAELTKLFNYYFGDTSYLSQAFDNVASAMTDLASQMSSIGSVEFDYIVQKWLGSLGSVGVEDNTLTSIATAINALGTGQVDQLAGSEMQNLLVMAANRRGLNYGEMLLEGINANQVNELLYGIIEYIQDTVSGANNVVKAQYAQLFGLTVADINAFDNISEQVISQLYSSAMSYQDTLISLDEQLSLIPERIHFSELADNMMDNLLAGVGINIANSSGLYTTYKIFDTLEKLTGGIHIPTISILGSSITLPDSIEGMAKSIIVGIGTAMSLIDAVGGWMDGAGLNRTRWEGNWNKGTYTGFTSMNELQTTKSSTGTVSNTDETGMQQSVYDEQSESAEEISGKEQQDEEDSKMVQLLQELVNFFQESQSSEHPIYVQLQEAPDKTGLGQQLSIPALLKAIKDRVETMGTDESPVYAVNDVIYGDKSDWTEAQRALAGLIPGQQI